MAMSDEARDALRIRNQLRPIQCRRCGGLGTRTEDGSTCDGMPGLLYRLRKATPKGFVRGR